MLARATAFWCVCLSVALGLRAEAAADKPPLNFNEVLELLRANLAGVTGEQLNEAAGRGYRR